MRTRALGPPVITPLSCPAFQFGSSAPSLPSSCGDRSAGAARAATRTRSRREQWRSCPRRSDEHHRSGCGSAAKPAGGAAATRSARSDEAGGGGPSGERDPGRPAPGYPPEELARILSERGVPINVATLRGYLRRTRKVRKTAQSRSKRAEQAPPAPQLDENRSVAGAPGASAPRDNAAQPAPIPPNRGNTTAGIGADAAHSSASLPTRR